jgi:hypothetical protein
VKFNPGYAVVLFGTLLLVFNNWASRFAVKSQNRFWGFNFGEPARKMMRIGYAAVGIIFLLVGLLSIFDVIHFKGY